MAEANRIVDFTDLKVQDHWYKLRHEFEHEIQGATSDTRRDYDVSVKLNGATIATDGGRSVLRVPVSARWRNDIEQTIAVLLVSDVEENEPRIAAIAHGVAEALERWVQREVPVRSSPVFLYPETEVRMPAELATAPPAATDATAPQPAETASA